MDESDDSILNPRADDSLDEYGHPNDIFEPNNSEIAYIKSELPGCDDSASQINTSSQLARKLFDDDSFVIPELNSESVSEPGPGRQERA